jgi:hypothetical protein
MTTRHIEMVDSETGEVLRGCTVFIPRKPIFKEKFFMLFQEPIGELATDRAMTGESLRMLLFLFSKMDYENYVNISQMEIADQLDIARSSVCRAMKVLVEKEVVLVSGKGMNKRYRLNPIYGWKGKIRNMASLRERDRTSQSVANV